MRNPFIVLSFVFAVTFGFGALTQKASGPGGSCYFTCSCSGQPLICCPTLSGGVSCKPTDQWNCPQVYEC